MSTDSMSAAAIVRRLRHAAGLSQRALADRLAISKSTVARIEMGHKEPPWSLVCLIAKLADASVLVFERGIGPVQPIATDGLRDGQGRRFPAHVDVRPVPPFSRAVPGSGYVRGGDPRTYGVHQTHTFDLAVQRCRATGAREEWELDRSGAT